MNIFKNTKLKKILLITGSILLGLYILFLVLPFAINPFLQSYCKDLEQIIKDAGFNSKVEGIGITTSPKFAIGVKLKKLELYIPEEKIPFFTSEDISGDLRLLPLFIKKVQLGKINAKKVTGSIVVRSDGSLLIEDYFAPTTEESEPMTSLPFGLKLSDRLPNIHIENYNFGLIDGRDNTPYYIKGDKFNITNFIFNKKIKLSTKGKIVFDKQTISNYNIKLFNKIMPETTLDDFIFPKTTSVGTTDQSEEENLPQKANPPAYNIIEILKSVNKNQLTADLDTDLKISGTIKDIILNGTLNVGNISVTVNGQPLPQGYANLKFKGTKTDIDSIFYTSSDKNEKTQIIGSVNTGKNIDFTLRSNAKINNIIRLIDSIAQSFNIKDLATISATGSIDADFNINSDFKKVLSTGYLKINPSSINYGLYNILIDKISADIDCMNNNINIKRAGFSIIGHPLNLTGTISPDAVADLKLTADKLSLKGLLGALGQIQLLKENDINSGSLSLNAIIKGKLTEIKPDINLTLANLNLYNKASEVRVLLSNALIKLILNNNKISGNIGVNSLALKHAAASVSVPTTSIVMDEKDIKINKSYVLINNSRVDVSGYVKDYMNDSLNMNITASGNLAASDVAVFIPTEVRSMFKYTGSMPINIRAKGNQKTQDICFQLQATPSGYVQFADIDLLRGKNTKIHTDMKISGDTLKFSDSGIYANSTQIASFSGGVNNLTSNPKLNITVNIPKNVSFPIWGMGESNITANGSINILGEMLNPKIKGKVILPDISIKDMDFAIKNLVANLNGSGIGGHATADSMKFGGIVAKKLASKFSLINYNKFYLNDITGTAFDGKINGRVSYDIAKTAMGVELSGKGLNSTDAIYGAVGIPKALTGTLGFDTKFNASGVTDKEIINSMKGNVNFTVENGRFVSIGKLENLVTAQNVTSNSILKSAISAMSTVNALQETDRFKSIIGALTLSGGNANISSIKVAGPLMSYFVKGTYYIIPNSANLTILGRLDSKIISYLGPLGQLSAEKLLSYIPKIGAATSQLLNQLTSDPANEDVSIIPALTGGSTTYRDFKVLFNGPVEKSSSVKSFKWLSKCDTTQMNLKQDLQDAKEAAKTNIENKVKETQTKVENVKTNVQNTINTQKQAVEAQKQAIQQTKTDIQNIKNNAGQSATNLGNLLKNAAGNFNKQITPATNTNSSEQAQTQTPAETETQTQPATQTTTEE